MIPVDKNYVEFDLSKKYEDISKNKRIELLNNQLRWLNENKKEIYFKSKLLYNLYKENKLPNNMRQRCCNFILLEEKCKKYKSE